jgi:hypothetical protein
MTSGVGVPAASGSTARRAQMTISDPEDVPSCETPPDCPPDIREVSVRRFTTATGRRMLALSVEAYELYSGLIYIANIVGRFDVRDGPRADARVFFALTDLRASLGWACGRDYEQGGSLTHRYRLRERGNLLTCIVPLRELRPMDKRMRLQALSRGNRFVVDRAPDAGWGVV